MTTLMGDLQKRIEDAVGSTGTFDESLQKLANLYGIAPSSNPSRIIPVAADFDSSITTAPAALNYLLYNPDKLPTLGLDFINNTTLDSRITFTRALNTATYFNSAGLLTTANANVARFDYDPSTLAPRGLLIEEARTNSIRNNTMQGAVAGTPGTAPTNWGVGVNGSGLTIQLVGTGTENGITYIDYRFSGTTTSAVEFFIQPEAGTAVSASNGQTWTGSFYVRAVAGSIANINYARAITRGVNNVGVGLTLAAGADVKSSLSVGSISGLRTGATVTTADATTFAVQTYFACGHGSGVAIDITLRIGLPQLEQGAFATSVIPTTTTALTRNADVASMTGTNFSSWYNQSAGTFLTVYSLARPSSGSNQFTVRASDNGYNNSVAMNTSVTGFAAIATAFGGVFDGLASAVTPLTANVTARVAGCYATNDLAISFNGAAVVTDTSATIPTTLTRLDIGSDHAGVNRIQGGYIQRITYYPRRLSNAELQAITS